MEENRVLLNWRDQCSSSDLIQFTECTGKLNLLTKKETMRELRSSIPALQAEKVSWLMDSTQATENMDGSLFKNKNIGIFADFKNGGVRRAFVHG